MDRCINWFLALLMAAMVVIISAQVWYRFMLNDPLSWSEEAGRYLFVWISFIGAAAGVRYQVHLGIDLMDKLLSPNAYKWAVVLVNVIIQIFLLMIIYWGSKYSELSSSRSPPPCISPCAIHTWPCRWAQYSCLSTLSG